VNQLTQKMADFRKQQEELRLEDSAFTKARKARNLNSEKKQFIDRNRYVITLVIVFALAMVVAQVGWVIFGQETNNVGIVQSDTPDRRYSNALNNPTADQLEERISSLTGNMQTLSGLLNDMESKLIATDQVEKRISGLNENLEKLNSMTTDLESKQMAADKLDARISGLAENIETLNSMTTDLESKQMAAARLEERISKITTDLQLLSDLAAGVESKQKTALATTGTIVPATQKLVSSTTELPSVSKEVPAIQTQQASAPATLEPKPVTDAPLSKRDTSRTEPKERRDSVVSKEPSASVTQNGPWTINLISSPDKAYAVSFSDSARSKGISTELQEVSVKGTPYWRVQVTGFSTQAAANDSADSIKDQLGLTDIWVLKR